MVYPHADRAFVRFRLQAITEAQRRARVALFLVALASGTILVTEWNSYLSWDQKWAAEAQDPPKHWGQKQLLAEQIKSWVETNTVNVALLGIRVSVSDAAVLGSLILLVFSFYLCVCLRRENHEIGTLLRSMMDASPRDQRIAYVQILSSLVLVGPQDNDAPIETLNETREPSKRLPLSSSVMWLLTFLPGITTAAVIVSDVFYATGYFSPWLRNGAPVWQVLSARYLAQLVLMDLFGAGCGVLTWVYCFYAWRYQRGTVAVLREFEPRLKNGVDQTT